MPPVIGGLDRMAVGAQQLHFIILNVALCYAPPKLSAVKPGRHVGGAVSLERNDMVKF